MKKKLLVFLYVIIAFSLSSMAQNFATIGLADTATQNTLYGPVYRYSATSTTTNGRGVMLYTQQELANAGVTPGSVISSIAFYKKNTGYFTTPATHNIYMSTVAAMDTSLSTTLTWDDITTNYTHVSTNTNLVLNNAIGWETFVINPFVYTGGNLVIGTHVLMAGNGAATSNITWQFTPGHSNKIVGNTTATTSSALNGSVVAYKQRPNVRIEYSAAPACSGSPTVPVITASVDSACLGEMFNINSTSSGIFSGLDMQWQSSTNGFVFTDMPGQTSPQFASIMATTLSYRLRTICTNTNDTVYSTPVTVSLKNFMNCYCTSNATSTSYGDIVDFSLAGQASPATVGTCNTYTDNSSTMLIGLKNMPLAVNAEILACSTNSTSANYLHVYIDYNQDGDFTDAGELAFSQQTNIGNLVTGNLTIPNSALNGNTKMRVVLEQTSSAANVNPCGTYTYGETEDYTLVINDQPANEVSLVSINSPQPTQCSFGNNIEVTVQNNGSTQVNNLEFDIIAGGIPFNSIAWTGTIAPGASANITIPGLFAFNDGDTLHVSVKNPNGVPDLTYDNGIGQRLRISLQGSYTVGYGFTDIPNKLFADMQVAIQELYNRGICTDTVYFNIKDDVYNATQFTLLGEYFNYQNGQIVIMQSESKNANNLEINFDATTSASNYIVKLDNTKGFGFKHITFVNGGTTYRSSILMDNEVSNVLIDSCIFRATGGTTGVTTYSTNNAAIRSVSGSKYNDIQVTNNSITGFGTGLYMYGESANYIENLVIKNNKFSEIHASALYAYYVKDLVFAENNVVMDTVPGGASTQYTMYLSYNLGADISRNYFITNQLDYGIYLNSTNTAGANGFLIANNFFYNGSTGTVAASAIRSASTANNGIVIANNSFNFNSTSTSTSMAMIYFSSGSGMSFINNNMASNGGLRMIHATSNATFSEIDYNNYYYPTGTNFGSYAGTVYAAPGDWIATTGVDQNSFTVNPNFVEEDLHTCAEELDGAAMPLSYITLDFDGEARNATFDIGADEFTGSAANLIANTFEEKCSNTAIQIGSAPQYGVTYSWDPTGEQTSEITVTNPGIYKLTATTTCGVFVDSIEVANIPAVTAAFDISGSYGLAALIQNNSTNGLSYLWNFGDGNTSTVADPYHLYSASGPYLITLTVYGVCDTVTSVVVFNAIALNTDEVEFHDLVLYPNPTMDIVNIKLPFADNAMFNVEIMDVTGKVVYSKNNLNGPIISIDAHNLSSGIYQIKLKTNSGSKVLPFVKK